MDKLAANAFFRNKNNGIGCDHQGGIILGVQAKPGR